MRRPVRVRLAFSRTGSEGAEIAEKQPISAQSKAFTAEHAKMERRDQLRRQQ
jgi:hypothetical protein